MAIISLVYLGPCCLCRIHAATESARPNVLIVMPDDLSFADFTHFDSMAPRTPHVDALAASSVRLTNFHVSTTCSPTRAALLTGRYNKLLTKVEHPKWTFVDVDASDVRFTRPKNGGALYAIPLAWPKAGGMITIKSINERSLPGKIASVTLLAGAGELKFSRSAEGLRVELPKPPTTAADAARPLALKIMAAGL